LSKTTTTGSPLPVLEDNAHVVGQYLKRLLHRYPDAPRRLMEAVSYSLLAGGKRLRPALVMESCRACAGDESAQASALAAAAAIELIHTFSLVHDDLPAMDDDDLRRGVPTNHKVFGEALAILAGDAMVAMAFELLALDAADSMVRPMVAELAAATGPQGMVGGQALDIQAQNKPLPLDELQRLHRKKTGALLRAACRLGAIAAQAHESKLAALTEFGTHLGLAFQIVDDLLDLTASAAELGKATRKDAGKGKATYPSLLGIEASRHQAADRLQAALKALYGFGSEADGLRELARFVVERSR
jgi:geranylgeranyl diphosphate synthase type II